MDQDDSTQLHMLLLVIVFIVSNAYLEGYSKHSYFLKNLEYSQV